MDHVTVVRFTRACTQEDLRYKEVCFMGDIQTVLSDLTSIMGLEEKTEFVILGGYAIVRITDVVRIKILPCGCSPTFNACGGSNV